MTQRRREAAPDEIGAPDIEITASAKADRLRFQKVPETEVSFHGSSERESVSGTERENLPDEVEPGVDYRDARIRLRIAARITEAGGGSR